MEKIIAAVGHVLDKVNFQRVVLLFVLVLMGVTTLSFYENRERIYHKVFKPGVLSTEGLHTVSLETKEQIDKLLSVHQEIDVLTVLKFDFSQGKRVPIYRGFNNPEIARRVGERLEASNPKGPIYGTVPIFTDDRDSNMEIVAILNGEFLCTVSGKGGIYTAFPELAGRIKMSCRIPIPPAINYGAPRGYIAVHFKESQSPEQLALITKELLSLAMFIYMNDVKGLTTFKVIEG